jgi:hypothetical protein
VRRRIIVPAAATLLLSLGLLAPPASAAIPVHCPGQNLQTKINSAAPGATISITGTCRGNFVLNKDVTLQGTPSATLDGDDTGSTMTITGAPTVHLVHLVVTGGRAAGGGGIDQAGGTLTLLHVTVQDNLAEGATATGGGISGAGVLKITQSSIAHNRAAASANGAPANGDGGGLISSGSVTISGSTISSNRATANATGNGASAFGGGIVVQGGGLTVTNTKFTGNHAEASANQGALLQAIGGAIADVGQSSTANVTGSTFSQNAAVSRGLGSASPQSLGGALALFVSVATVSTSTFTGSDATSSATNADASANGAAVFANVGSKAVFTSVRVLDSTATATGAGDARASGAGISLQGGTASIASSTIRGGLADAENGSGIVVAAGGGVFTESVSKLTVTKSTIEGNHLVARSPGSSPDSLGAGIASQGPTAISASTVSGNVAAAIAPNGNAAAVGGGVDLSQSGTSSITNSTVTGNTAKATGSSSGSAVAVGGGIESSTVTSGLTVTAGTVARNVIEGSAGTLSASGGGLRADSGTATLHGTILALNTAPTSADGPNCGGSVTIVSGGHNLLGKMAGCSFAHQPSDLINQTAPGLAALANNGGPTETIALTTASPARNAFAPPCPVKADQRGVHRPQGPRCDIGAFERA